MCRRSSKPHPKDGVEGSRSGAMRPTTAVLCSSPETNAPVEKSIRLRTGRSSQGGELHRRETLGEKSGTPLPPWDDFNIDTSTYRHVPHGGRGVSFFVLRRNPGRAPYTSPVNRSRVKTESKYHWVHVHVCTNPWLRCTYKKLSSCKNKNVKFRRFFSQGIPSYSDFILAIKSAVSIAACICRWNTYHRTFRPRLHGIILLLQIYGIHVLLCSIHVL